MDPWKILLLKFVFFFISAPILGFALLWTVEFTQQAWKTNQWKKKWLAMSLIAGFYLVLRGLFL